MHHLSDVEEFIDSACSPLGLVVRFSLCFIPLTAVLTALHSES